jgi:hypothetical protein
LSSHKWRGLGTQLVVVVVMVEQEDNIFVNRVNKRDAPNYYDVIARPMYLNLMTKKLKKGDYFSKAEFRVRVMPSRWCASTFMPLTTRVRRPVDAGRCGLDHLQLQAVQH